MKQLYVCDAIPGTTWFDPIDTIDDGLRELDHLTKADRKRREYFAIVSADLDEDGEIDLETVEEKILFILDGKLQSFSTECYEYNAEDDTERWRGGTDPEWSWTEWRDATWK